jgi:hypothetical protein
VNGLTKNDSERLGFVISCLFKGAIDVAEFHRWVTMIFEEDGTPPGYMVDLLEFKGPLASVFKVIGFVPHWPYSEDEELALFGITFNRGRTRFECPLSTEEAIEKLRQFPRIEKRFRSEFPFINW